ncbi:MAG: NUDIX hydrolase, partial [Alphaproteobacteria bacterium]
FVLPSDESGIYYSRQEQPNKKPFLGLFGGRMEHGEEPLEAVQRELLEESGLVSDDWQMLASFQPVGKIDWTVYFFIARKCRKVAEQHLDAGEKIEIVKTSVDDFLTNVVAHPDFREMELKNMIFSAFNPTQANELKALLS